MKLDQFKALCDREWSQEGSRGDITVLNLTDESHLELSNDMLMAGAEGSHILYIDKSELADIAGGGAVSTIVNPITRSVIKIVGGADSDTAEVYAIPESRIVTCN